VLQEHVSEGSNVGPMSTYIGPKPKYLLELVGNHQQIPQDLYSFLVITVYVLAQNIYDGEADHDREADQALGITTPDVLDPYPHQFRSKYHRILGYPP